MEGKATIQTMREFRRAIKGVKLYVCVEGTGYRGVRVRISHKEAREIYSFLRGDVALRIVLLKESPFGLVEPNAAVRFGCSGFIRTEIPHPDEARWPP